MKVSNSSIFNNKKTGIIMSVVSLILIVCLLVVATYSWVEAGNEGEVDSSNNLSFDVTPDLDISGDNVTNGKIEIKDFVLREVSSVDGRNVYVPDDSFYEKTTGNGTQTEELRFREANPADVYDGKKGTAPPANMRYVAFSFYISSPSGVDTDVYLSSTSKITGTGADYVRMSIDTHDGNAPKVFSSSASVGYPVHTDAVSSIKSSGEYKDLSSQKAEAFATYAYVGEANPLFILKANEKKRVTVTLWLEGASGDFPDTGEESIVGKTLSAHINLKTTQDYTNTIKVVDRTLDNWAYNSKSYLFVYDANTTNVSYKMEYDSNTSTWTAKVPQNVTKVYFRRWNPDDSSVKWNYWGDKEKPITVPGAEKLYTTGSDSQKENGLNLTYNLIGNYDSQLPDVEAGIWGEFDDINFREIYFFDQSSSALDDTDGYFNGDITPFINMTVSYEYNGENISTNLCYRMYKNYVGNRMFRQIMFIPPTTEYTVTTTFDSYTYTEDASGASVIIKGSKSISADISSIGTKKFFAYCGSDTTGNYWGVGMNYLSNKGIYTKDTTGDAKTNGVRYAMYYYEDNNNNEWHSMCRWNDEYTKNKPTSTTKFPEDGVNEWVYACVNPGYSKAIYGRMNGSKTTNNFNSGVLWNQSEDNTKALTNPDFSITEFKDGKLSPSTYSTWPDMPGR